MAGEVWLRVVVYEGSSGDVDEQFIRDAAQEAVRVLEKTPGCTLGYWGNDKKAGTMAAVTYWTSLEAIEAAQPTLEKLQSERASSGVKVVSANNFKLREYKLD